MSAIRTLKRNIRERETGKRGTDSAEPTITAKTYRNRKQRARRRRAIARATKLSRTGG